MIPTRRIEKAEFEELIKLSGYEGDTLILWELHAFDYVDDPVHVIDVINYQEVNILRLNVLEPVIYKDDNLGPIVVVPMTEDHVEYDDFSDWHVKKGCDGYYLAMSFWEINDWDYDLDDVYWAFKGKKKDLPPFDLDDWRTH